MDGLDDGQASWEGIGRAMFLLRASLDSIPDGILVEDPRGRVVLANQVFCAMFDIDAQATDLVGRKADELGERIALATKRPEPFRARVRAIVERKRAVEAEPFVLADGRILERDYWPLFVTEDERGHCWRYRDVTEQRRMDERLRVADRMASLGTLAAGVAHEINNPLAQVTANLEFLLEHLGAPGPQTELESALRDGREAIDRVRDIVRDLKTLSRGEDELRGPVDVPSLLASTIDASWSGLRSRARLVRDFGSVPLVEANASRLGQVFLNLLINAVQAIPEGTADAEVRVATRADQQGHAIIEVSDTGVGIAPDVLPRLFDPFFTTKPVGAGTGLGLAICHRTIASMGGEILVESRLGAGTTFRILLPGTAPRAATAARGPTPLPPVARRGRILVVDDEPLIGTALRRLLGADHEVITVQRAAEGLALARKEPFDVVLCDLMMPDMTGMDLHAELERTDRDLLERVIFMTGGTVTSRATAFRSSVSNAFVDKPFDVTVLRSLIRERVR